MIRPGTPADVPRALEIWRAAVDATHCFLTPEHRAEIDILVAEHFLPNAALWLALDESGLPQGFLVMDGEMIDALFVDPVVHGRGYGTALLTRALEMAPNATVDASEQATNARPSTRPAGSCAPAGPRPIPTDGPIHSSICAIGAPVPLSNWAHDAYIGRL